MRSGTARVNADINDNGGVDGIRLSVTVVNPQGRAISRTGPENLISADTILFGGAGNYLVIIAKTGGSLFFSEPMTATLTVRPPLGVDTLHNVVLVQDQ